VASPGRDGRRGGSPFQEESGRLGSVRDKQNDRVFHVAT
jgi:hypothetical protein